MRLCVTSDLHMGGSLTSAAAIDAIVARIAADTPDAVVIAGDVAHGYKSFEACIGKFAVLNKPVFVLAGNHDLWVVEKGRSTEELWQTQLQAATERAGAVWLENEVPIVNGVAIVGTLAWYDYSAIDREFALPQSDIISVKRRLNNDAVRMDWKRTDPDFAHELQAKFYARLDKAAALADAIAVVTHVPVLEEQMSRKPGNRTWGVGNAFFGNLTLGPRILAAKKVRCVVSGHTHCGKEAKVGGVDVRVVGSDYGAPVHVTLEIE